MRSARLLLVVMAGVALSLVAATSAYAELKAGVVDIVKVTNKSDRTTDANNALKAEMDALKAKAEPLFKKVQDLEAKRDGLKKGTDDWKKADEEALKAQVEFQAWSALEQAKIERKHRDILLDMYHQITNIVARVAKEKGLDIVFTKAFLEPPQINLDEAQGLEDLKNRIINQRVLYPTGIMDITDQVLDTLNKEYAASKAVAAPK